MFASRVAPDSRRNIAAAAIAALAFASALGGCSSESTSAPAGPVPLADALPTLKPALVWQHFYELTRVPRPSHHEGEATALVAEFGRGLGLETTVDGAGNVLIREPATAGMEGRPTVVLQAHLDMVAQKTDSATTDPRTDPIDAVVEDGWVHASGTTLGADDGIGVAIIMAILEASDVLHGPLEALFTTNEEDGVSGINDLSPDVLKGRRYVNVDNEIEGLFIISSAGGVDIDLRESYGEVATPSGMAGYQITVDGLIGGHSGIDIASGRGSAHHIIARLLHETPAEIDLRVASVAGGDVYNAIPRKASAVVALPASQGDAFRAYVAGFAATVASELATTDPGVAVTLVPVARPPTVMEATAQRALIAAVDAAPQGVIMMSSDVPGLVETSVNLGILGIAAGQFTGGALARSAVDTERDAVARQYAEVFELAGATVTFHSAYSSWPPNPTSPLLALMQHVYSGVFGSAPMVGAVHAGLETSVAGTKYPGMDMISVGPTVENVHSPDERLNVASVGKVYSLLLETLRQIQ